MTKKRGHWRPELRRTKRQWQGFTKTQKLQAMSNNINFENFKVVGFEANYQERLFLEAWHSTLDLNTRNDHIVLRQAFKAMVRAWITWSRAQASRYVTLNNVWHRTLLSYHWSRLKHQPKRHLTNIKGQWETFFFHRTYDLWLIFKHPDTRIDNFSMRLGSSIAQIILTNIFSFV